jgi:hypothetical protein
LTAERLIARIEYRRVNSARVQGNECHLCTSICVPWESRSGLRLARICSEELVTRTLPSSTHLAAM